MATAMLSRPSFGYVHLTHLENEVLKGATNHRILLSPHMVWVCDSSRTFSLLGVFLQLEPRKASRSLCHGELVKGECLGALWPHL